MKKEILKMTVDEFKKHLRENSDNVFEGSGIAEDFEDIQKDFGLYCKKMRKYKYTSNWRKWN